MTTQPAAAPPPPGVPQVAVENRQVYRLSRPDRSLRAWLLPEEISLEVTTYLTIDQKTDRVLHHEDAWHRPRLVLLPRFARRANAAVTNGAFRLLGWGRLLEEVETHPKSDLGG